MKERIQRARLFHLPILAATLMLAAPLVAAAQSDRFRSDDLLKLREVTGVKLSPDGSRRGPNPETSGAVCR